MIIETICAYPWQVVSIAIALLGGVGVGIHTYLKKKKESKEKFDSVKFIDTVWQSTLVGYGAGFAIGCGVVGILLTFASAIGLDKFTNKYNINIKNLIEKITKK